MARAGSCLSLGPDGETGFVKQGRVDKDENISHEKSLLKAGMERFSEKQRVMCERFAALKKEATNRQVEAVENQTQPQFSPSVMRVTKLGSATTQFKCWRGQRAPLPYTLQHTLLVVEFPMQQGESGKIPE